jgi:glyoxylase-like metal-dependent hydrolase (beta-lactamase superfamily II)
VRSRPDALLLPAHGPVAASAHARVDELAEHHARRLEQSEAAVVDKGARTASDVATLLRWTRRDRALDELDLFNRMLAVLETEAHLVLLVAQKRLVANIEDGRRTYAPV